MNRCMHRIDDDLVDRTDNAVVDYGISTVIGKDLPGDRDLHRDYRVTFNRLQRETLQIKLSSLTCCSSRPLQAVLRRHH